MQTDPPAGQPERTGPVSVHEDAQWKCCGAQQEGADCEAQVEHLLLVHTALPLPALQGRQVAAACLVLFYTETKVFPLSLNQLIEIR